ncbi:MAG TPA: hypothetical protein PKN13_11925 [Accumulibacter sp.]|nr:hypothetical protein [Accumulibacter sp.]HMW18714.1 hypothetical protein [Accumulibacter sp.]HMX23299.1 hypothetical protein [Accumulibacter sp.]HNC18587.1 hypothetical protein [Accumulibacter sp.]HND81360.1 hypothetical protein [Accumulibacter sp.]
MNHRKERQRSHVARVAARLLVEEGAGDISRAKRKAARQLGVSDRAELPDDHEIEEQQRVYQRLFQEDDACARLDELRRAALRLMVWLQRFKPYLSGSVLEGSAGRHAEIDIQLFPDSAKEVEIFLLNEKIDYRHSVPRTDRAEAVLTFDDSATVNLVIYPPDQERVNFKTRDGRNRPRARIDTVRKLLIDEANAKADADDTPPASA